MWTHTLYHNLTKTITYTCSLTHNPVTGISAVVIAEIKSLPGAIAVRTDDVFRLAKHRWHCGVNVLSLNAKFNIGQMRLVYLLLST